MRSVRPGNYTEANDFTRHSVVHSVFVGVTIDGGYHGPVLAWTNYTAAKSLVKSKEE